MSGCARALLGRHIGAFGKAPFVALTHRKSAGDTRVLLDSTRGLLPALPGTSDGKWIATGSLGSVIGATCVCGAHRHPVRP